MYAFDAKAGSKHARASAILTAASEAGARLPLQVLGEVFAVLTRRRGWSATDAREVVTGLIDLVPVIAASPTSLVRAMKLSESHGVSFWDAQIAAAAAEGGCTILLSEDSQDGRRFSAADLGRALAIVDPFEDANLPILINAGLLST